MSIIDERMAAKAKGYIRYKPSKPCKHGHLSDRYVTGQCVECAQLAMAKYALKTPGKVIPWIRGALGKDELCLILTNVHPDDRKMLQDFAEALAVARGPIVVQPDKPKPDYEPARHKLRAKFGTYGYRIENGLVSVRVGSDWRQLNKFEIDKIMGRR